MTVPGIPAPDPQQTPITLGAVWRMWLTMVVFGVVNFLVIIGISSVVVGIIAGLVYLAVIAALAALIYKGFGWRYVALGLLAGYLLMTLCSAGVCTLINPNGGIIGNADNGAVAGFFIYPAALFIFFVALVIASIVAEARNK